MAMIFMQHGGVCHVSDEDHEAASRYKWRGWALHPSGRETAWFRHQSGHRRYDIFLHRLVAVRMDPNTASRRFTVYPIDGDYLNCRRDNLEIQLHGKKAAHVKKRSRILFDRLPGRRTSLPDDLAALRPAIRKRRKVHHAGAGRADGPHGRAVDGNPGQRSEG